MLEIDYKYIASLNLDSMRSTIERLDWMFLTNYNLKTNRELFIGDFLLKEFLAAQTTQQIAVESTLNELLLPNSPIYITNGFWYHQVFIYFNGEIFSEPTYLYHKAEAQPSTFLYHKVEFEDDQVDFIVLVETSDLANLEDKIHYYINLYKSLGKTYRIDTY